MTEATMKVEDHTGRCMMHPLAEGKVSRHNRILPMGLEHPGAVAASCEGILTVGTFKAGCGP